MLNVSNKRPVYHSINYSLLAIKFQCNDSGVTSRYNLCQALLISSNFGSPRSVVVSKTPIKIVYQLLVPEALQLFPNSIGAGNINIMLSISYQAKKLEKQSFWLKLQCFRGHLSFGVLGNGHGRFLVLKLIKSGPLITILTRRKYQRHCLTH